MRVELNQAMITQPELAIQPREMIVTGMELADTVARLKAAGARVTGMEVVSHCNGTWRLELCWPQQQQEHNAN